METNKRTSGKWMCNLPNQIISYNGKDKLTIATTYDPETMHSIREFNTEDPNEESKANVAFIVTACNGYESLLKERDELKEALQACRNWFDNHGNDYEIGLPNCFVKAKRALNSSTVKEETK